VLNLLHSDKAFRGGWVVAVSREILLHPWMLGTGSKSAIKVRSHRVTQSRATDIAPDSISTCGFITNTYFHLLMWNKSYYPNCWWWTDQFPKVHLIDNGKIRFRSESLTLVWLLYSYGEAAGLDPRFPTSYSLAWNTVSGSVSGLHLIPTLISLYS